MKSKAMAYLCAGLMGLSIGTSRSMASCTDPVSVAVDAVVVRPISFAATIVGSVIFVISLPVAATSHSVHVATKALVVQPAEYTFTRPLGEFDDLADY